MAEGILVKNAAHLARAFVQALRDMRGWDYRLDGGARHVRPSAQPFSMRVAIRFSGQASGEYGICLSPETAALLAGCWKPEQGLPALAAARDEYESFVKEALNVAVGEAIQALDAPGGCEFKIASVDYEGSGRESPRGELLVLGSPGPVACSFLLDQRGGAKAA